MKWRTGCLSSRPWFSCLRLECRCQFLNGEQKISLWRSRSWCISWVYDFWSVLGWRRELEIGVTVRTCLLSSWYVEWVVVHDGQQSCTMLWAIWPIRSTMSLERSQHTCPSTNLIGHPVTLTRKQCALRRGVEDWCLCNRELVMVVHGTPRSFKRAKLDFSCWHNTLELSGHPILSHLIGYLLLPTGPAYTPFCWSNKIAWVRSKRATVYWG